MKTVLSDAASDGAVLATMHGKERVIAPLVQRFLGFPVAVAAGLNTDAFGTFTRDIPRSGLQHDAARAKIDAAFSLMPRSHVALASEGSFGPHPQLPLCAIDREIVMLADRARDLELVGYCATADTNFSHAVVADVAAGMAFAERCGFPGHGIIVMGCRDGNPAPDIALEKNATTTPVLVAALGNVIAACGSAFVETDMRAHRNPRRMRAIKRATIDLLRRVYSCCPACGQPGYVVTDRVAGLPCALCSEPTMLPRAAVLTCAGCARREERPVAQDVADPSYCGECNP